MISAPFAPSPTTSSVSQLPPKVDSFPELLNLAMTVRGTRNYAEHVGIDETALIRYADGAVCDGGEHLRITRLVSKNDWALNFIANHVKQKRQGQLQRRVA
jgi:hypothetical protein